MIIGSTSVAKQNDIVRKSNNNVAINGRYISQATQSSSTSLAGLYYYRLDGYTQANNNPYLTSLSWTQAKNSTEIVVPYNFLFPNAFQVGDFIRYDGDVYGYVTDLTGSSPSNGWRIQAGTFAYGHLSGSDLDIIRNNAGQISTYTPQSFTFYDSISVDTYDDTIDIFDKIDYGFFNKTTNDIYTPVVYNQYQNDTVNFYSNNTYNAQTSTQIDLPAVALPDTFVVKDFAQSLSQKTFSDDTTFQQDIDVVDVRASGDIGCVDITATGNIGCVDLTASGDIGCVDITASGKLITNTIEDTTQVQTLINGNQRFNVTNSLTRLREQDGSVIDAFCNSTNSFIDITTSNGNSDYTVRLQTTAGTTTAGQGYLNVYGNLILPNGYIAIDFKNTQTLPHNTVYTIPFTTNTLPQGFTKNDIGGGFSSTITNNSGYDRTLCMGGNMSLNGGTSGFFNTWLGTTGARLHTFQAPLENGSTSVTMSFTYRISNGQTVFFNAYQNSGATRTIKNDGVFNSRVYGQIL
jgi:hypothetical protein